MVLMPLLLTLSDLESHFRYLKSSIIGARCRSV